GCAWTCGAVTAVAQASPRHLRACPQARAGWVAQPCLVFPPLALTLFRRCVFANGSQLRRSHVRGCFGRDVSRYFSRCFGGHFLLVEKGEGSTITQFPESIQEKDGGETQKDQNHEQAVHRCDRTRDDG